MKLFEQRDSKSTAMLIRSSSRYTLCVSGPAVGTHSVYEVYKGRKLVPDSQQRLLCVHPDEYPGRLSAHSIVVDHTIVWSSNTLTSLHFHPGQNLHRVHNSHIEFGKNMAVWEVRSVNFADGMILVVTLYHSSHNNGHDMHFLHYCFCLVFLHNQ